VPKLLAIALRPADLHIDKPPVSFVKKFSARFIPGHPGGF
jgi:hypothetical protein